MSEEKTRVWGEVVGRSLERMGGGLELVCQQLEHRARNSRASLLSSAAVEALRKNAETILGDAAEINAGREPSNLFRDALDDIPKHLDHWNYGKEPTLEEGYTEVTYLMGTVKWWRDKLILLQETFSEKEEKELVGMILDHVQKIAGMLEKFHLKLLDMCETERLAS